MLALQRGRDSPPAPESLGGTGKAMLHPCMRPQVPGLDGHMSHPGGRACWSRVTRDE